MKNQQEMQEIFDTVYRHFIIEKQRFSFETQASGEFEACRYRGPNGEKCAVGLFLPDDEYNPEMENAQLRTLILTDEPNRISPSLVALCGGPDHTFVDINPNFKLLDALQQAHDRAASSVPQEGADRCRQDFEISLTRIARQYHLTIPTA